eukprot:3033897-Rhodomonas_salina.3
MREDEDEKAHMVTIAEYASAKTEEQEQEERPQQALPSGTIETISKQKLAGTLDVKAAQEWSQEHAQDNAQEAFRTHKSIAATASCASSRTGTPRPWPDPFRYASRTWFLFTLKNPIRKGCIWLTEQKFWDRGLLTLILLNTVQLAIYDPFDSPGQSTASQHIFMLCFCGKRMNMSGWPCHRPRWPHTLLSAWDCESCDAML